jgi:hypothetical protein
LGTDRFNAKGKPDSNGEYASTPLEVISGKGSGKTRAAVNDCYVARGAYSTVEEVKASDLKTTQPTVNVERVQDYINNPDRPADEANPGSGNSLLAVRIQGNTVIVDGNHRAAAAALEGKSLKLEVVDMDSAYRDTQAVRVEHPDWGYLYAMGQAAAAHKKVRKDFNPDEARDESGKWTSGGGDSKGAADPSKDQKKMETLTADMSTFDAHSAMIRNEARRQGYPVSKVSVAWGTQNFKVGDQEFTKGGEAERSSGQITIYPQAFADQVNLTGMSGVMSHEIEHTRFNAVMSVYDQEATKLHTLAVSDHVSYDAVTRGNGYLDHAKSAEQFPVMTKLEPYLDENRDKMVKDDGVTDYSKAYWTAMSENKGVNYRTAVSETLSEISRLKTDGNAKGNVSRDWLNFHGAVNKLAKDGGL